MSRKINLIFACVIGVALASYKVPVSACTGISLQGEDGGVVVARTVEWALGDAKHNRIVIFPRGKVFRAQRKSDTYGNENERTRGSEGLD